jgi:hypothetical protein
MANAKGNSRRLMANRRHPIRKAEIREVPRIGRAVYSRCARCTRRTISRKRLIVRANDANQFDKSSARESRVAAWIVSTAWVYAG